MSFSKTSSKKVNNSLLLNYLKGLVVAMVISFALIIVLACSLKWFSLDEKYISPLNLAIKTISVAIGSLVAIKGESRGLFKGVCFGLLYIFLAFISFSALAGSFSMDISFLLDIAFSCLAGGLVGILKVNAR